MKKSLVLRGVYPAHLTPFREDYSMDEDELRRHIRALVEVKGVAGLISNGHAGEVTALSRNEYIRVLQIVKEEAGEDFPIISGVLHETPQGAIETARIAKDSGADAILLFPPNLFANGGALNSELPFKFIAAVAHAVDIPIVVFQFSIESGIGYTVNTLVKIVEEIPSVIAIKEGSNNIQRYEENVRALRDCSRKVSILCSNNTKLLASLAIDGDGIISGSGSVIADLLVELWEAIESGNLARAREVNERIFPLTQVFYADPLLNMHNRMKVALQILGRQQRAIARPPLAVIKSEEREKIREVLIKGGVL